MLRHLWTISYEEQFYLLVPFAAVGLLQTRPAKNLIILVVIFLTLTVVRLVFIDHLPVHPSIWVLPVTHFEALFLGFVLGISGMPSTFRLHWYILISVSVVSFVGLAQLPNLDVASRTLMISYPLAALSVVAFLMAVRQNSPLKRLLSLQPVVFLGKRSYGLYIWHLPAARIFDALHVLPLHPFVAFVGIFFITVVLSILSYRFLESPFLKLKKRYEIVPSRPV